MNTDSDFRFVLSLTLGVILIFALVGVLAYLFPLPEKIEAAQGWLRLDGDTSIYFAEDGKISCAILKKEGLATNYKYEWECFKK